MELRLHKTARTTPAVRAKIAASTEGVSAMARRYGIGRISQLKYTLSGVRDVTPSFLVDILATLSARFSEELVVTAQKPG
jgi:hypothetical protein